MSDIRVKSDANWKAQADAAAERFAQCYEAGIAYALTFYCDTREQAHAVDEYMRNHHAQVNWSTVASQNPHEMDEPLHKPNGFDVT